MAAMQLTRTHRILIGLVIAGALIIAGIGFAGSYAAVRELAVDKGFGTFSYFFPIGIDAGICVLLALDLLLTWLRIPFPLLRQTAWILTAATIAFNGAAAWPDPLGVGMHAVIPILFVVSVEAARHAVGRIADITADKHMEGVRLTRWLLSPVPTFRLWRRMKLWELRSYEQVIKLEQERLIYQARLQARYGRSWRRKAPVEALMPLRLARYGVPLAETAAAGLAAAGIEPAVLPPQAQAVHGMQPVAAVQAAPALQPQQPQQLPQAPQQPQQHPQVGQQGRQGQQGQAEASNHDSPWFQAPHLPSEAIETAYDPQYVDGLAPTPVAVPLGPEDVPIPDPRHEQGPEAFEPYPEYVEEPEPRVGDFEETVYKITWSYVHEHKQFPGDGELQQLVAAHYGVPEFPDTDLLHQLTPVIQQRIQQEMADFDTA
ncbi:DUF2637 domain-containing protein [Streptomyces sp. NBC_01255]|uniref:DUF2637 domain-containing protein n=1 Tax=Streptomyces sp. NBC_01255 TaxID=2903798 RepID=UPI002E35E40C|nr:DUF2637 domain-containing protein [Streptomyces sp. NBC_01255]